jgi:hypothetical protein
MSGAQEGARHAVKIPLWSRVLILRRRNPRNSHIFPVGKSNFLPTMKRGPFYLTGLISWKWGEVELSLKRWL